MEVVETSDDIPGKRIDHVDGDFGGHLGGRGYLAARLSSRFGF
jgi:hypothetical protein